MKPASNTDRAIVVVIDDDRSIQEALRALLETVALRVMVFDSIKNFLNANAAQDANCIVLDVRLPGESGLELQGQLRAARVNTPIVFITGHGDIQMSVRAMKGGAIEFLTKPFRDQELLDAVLSGIERDRAKRAERDLVGQIRTRYASLTAREAEIMALLVSGQMSKQVAGKVGISEVTVRVHRVQIMRKMGARSIAELVRMADGLKDA